MALGRKTGGRKKGSRNKRTRKQLMAIQRVADYLLDKEWQAAAKIRFREGQAPHLETFFAAHKWGKPTDRVELGNLKRETFKHEDKSKKAPFNWAEYHKAFNEFAKGQATISETKGNQESVLPREGD